MEISGYNVFLDLMSLSLLAKGTIENEIEGRNKENWGIGARPTNLTLRFPYLILLSYSIIKLYLIMHFSLIFLVLSY